MKWIEIEIDDESADILEERRRLDKVLHVLHDIVDGIDPEFYPQQWLDQINSHLRDNSFFHQLQSFSKSPQVTYLQTANNHITQYAPLIFQLSAMTRPIESKKLINQAERASKSFSKAMERKANQTDERFAESQAAFEEFKAMVGRLEQQVSAIEAETTEKLANWQSAFVDAQTTRVEEHSNDQMERNSEFEKLVSTTKETVENLTSELANTNREKLLATVNHYEEVGDRLVLDMKEKHKSVLELHGLVGRDSVAGGYQKNATEEQAAANRWRVLSMLSLVLAVIWLGTKYFLGFEPSETGEFNWAEIVTASSITAIFLLAAGYSSRQSKLHRDNEKQMRWFALETKALDPFIASLDVPEQKAIKAELVRRMFGRQQNSGIEKSSKIDEGTLKTIADRLGETVRDTVGKLLDKG